VDNSREPEPAANEILREQLPAPQQAEQTSLPVSRNNMETAAPVQPTANAHRVTHSRGIYQATHLFVYLALVFVIFQIERWLLASVQSNLIVLWWRLLVEGSMMLAAIVPGFAMARIENCSFGEFGLPARCAFGRNFWIGSLWGIGSLSVMMVVLRIAGAFDFGSLAIHGPRILKFAAYYAVLFLFTALFEEFLIRGYSQWILSRAIGFWPAAAILSAIFGYIHQGNPGEAKTGLVAAGFIGFFLCLTLRRTGDLWWAVGFHMAWDWGESFLFSVPDSGAILPGHLLRSTMHGPVWLSGGTVGPEGSYLVFAIIAALWMLFSRVYPQVRYTEAPVSHIERGNPNR
jgi:hypothetical protein